MNILFITHKMPYPPDKGEKIRAFNIIKHLSQNHKVFLYSLSDNKNDLYYIEKLNEYCASVNVYNICSFFSNLRAAMYLLTRYPFTFAYFFSYRMKKDIKKACKDKFFDMVFTYCSSSAQYVMGDESLIKCVDFMDIDSDKWKSYARKTKFPFSLIYTIESKRLARWEKKINETFDISIVTTEKEKERFITIDPVHATKIIVIKNGVDFNYFEYHSAKGRDLSLIFSGQMDYLPNIDAVIYFYSKILPFIRKQVPNVSFYIVGRKPTATVRRICKKAIVTGYVKDIRNYLAKAAVCVVSIRISHGVQNKILEAMASGLPVVVTSEALEGIDAIPGKEIMVGNTPEEFALVVTELLQNVQKRELISKNAQEYVKRYHNWKINLSKLDIIFNDFVNMQ